jgi:hypothetical protein
VSGHQRGVSRIHGGSGLGQSVEESRGRQATSVANTGAQAEPAPA